MDGEPAADARGLGCDIRSPQGLENIGYLLGKVFAIYLRMLHVSKFMYVTTLTLVWWSQIVLILSGEGGLFFCPILAPIYTN